MGSRGHGCTAVWRRAGEAAKRGSGERLGRGKNMGVRAARGNEGGLTSWDHEICTPDEVGDDSGGGGYSGKEIIALPESVYCGNEIN